MPFRFKHHLIRLDSWLVRHSPTHRILAHSNEAQETRIARLLSDTRQAIAREKEAEDTIGVLRKALATAKSDLDTERKSRQNAFARAEELQGRMAQIEKLHEEETLYLRQTVDWFCVSTGRRPMFGVAPKVERAQATPTDEPAPITGRQAVRRLTEEAYNEVADIIRKHGGDPSGAFQGTAVYSTNARMQTEANTPEIPVGAV